MNWTPTHINTLNSVDILIWVIGITVLRFLTLAPKSAIQVASKRSVTTGAMQRRTSKTVSTPVLSPAGRETDLDDNRWVRREQMLRKYQRPVAPTRRQTVSRPIKKAA